MTCEISRYVIPVTKWSWLKINESLAPLSCSLNLVKLAENHWCRCFLGLPLPVNLQYYQDNVNNILILPKNVWNTCYNTPSYTRQILFPVYLTENIRFTNYSDVKYSGIKLCDDYILFRWEGDIRERDKEACGLFVRQ